MSASVVMVIMARDIQFVLLAGVVVSVFSAVVIPDKVNTFQLDYVSTSATWHQHNEACRDGGGYLVLLEDPITTEILEEMDLAVGGMNNFFTRAVIHSDGTCHTHDGDCRPINMSLWNWEAITFDEGKQCTITKTGYQVESEECTHNHQAMCQYNVHCPFRSTSVSLASFPVSDANMSVCQDTCRQMTGCFATAPSGHATLPPYTHCLFIITNDSSNPMTTLDCALYTKDKGTNPENIDVSWNDEDSPHECTSSSAASDDEVWPLTDFLSNATYSVDCTETHITVSTVTDTITATTTATFTQTPVTGTANVTTTKIVTSTTTVLLATNVEYVTVPTTVEQIVITTVDRTVATTVDQTVTVTADRIVPTIADQTVTVTADRIVATTVDQTVTVTADRTVPTTVDERVTVTVDAGEPCTASTSSISTRPQEDVYVDLESMVKDLTVDPEAMSKQRRKKESARDERKSALAIGTVAVVFLTLVGLLIVGFDLTGMCRDIHRLKASIRESNEEKGKEEVG